MNFSWLLSLVSAIPYIVSGIQAIHGDAVSGATKKQLAMESLGLAGNVAVGTLTGDNQKYAAAATSLASSIIDSFVTTAKTTGLPGFTPPTPVVVPTPVVISGVATPAAPETGAAVK